MKKARLSDEAEAGDPAFRAASSDAEAEAPQRTSDVVRQVMESGAGDRITIRDLIGLLRERSFGIAALIFTLPAYLPLPPGLPIISGAALTLLAVQMIFGRRSIWLPEWMLRKSMEKRVFARHVGKVLPTFRAVERMTRPRWTILTSEVGKRILGGVLIILAVMMILPIPFLGNLPLALAASVLAIALTEDDGLLLAIGYGVALAALTITSIFAWLGLSLVMN